MLNPTKKIQSANTDLTQSITTDVNALRDEIHQIKDEIKIFESELVNTLEIQGESMRTIKAEMNKSSEQQTNNVASVLDKHNNELLTLKEKLNNYDSIVNNYFKGQNDTNEKVASVITNTTNFTKQSMEQITKEILEVGKNQQLLQNSILDIKNAQNISTELSKTNKSEIDLILNKFEIIPQTFEKIQDQFKNKFVKHDQLLVKMNNSLQSAGEILNSLEVDIDNLKTTITQLNEQQNVFGREFSKNLINNEQLSSTIKALDFNQKTLHKSLNSFDNIVKKVSDENNTLMQSCQSLKEKYEKFDDKNSESILNLVTLNECEGLVLEATQKIKKQQDSVKQDVIELKKKVDALETTSHGFEKKLKKEIKNIDQKASKSYDDLNLLLGSYHRVQEDNDRLSQSMIRLSNSVIDAEKDLLSNEDDISLFMSRLR
eukprot:TRINITY_DN2600_c0_g2_i1.p1 TRINITY_DN2600_c0_g2~~TRINITY_DN2600_c0_g2_i1.p1  ORF type:complete len:431 (+),score=118.75 TRINITY_DN2600_c0_g2_i1:1088-2380(+)